MIKEIQDLIDNPSYRIESMTFGPAANGFWMQLSYSWEANGVTKMMDKKLILWPTDPIGDIVLSIIERIKSQLL